MIIPIYKDTIFEYTGNTLEYSIDMNGLTIFQGKAYIAPGDDSIKININRICENYLNNDAVDEILVNRIFGSQTAYDAFKTFAIKDSSGNTLETYDFLYYYDYENELDMGDPYLNDPITDAYGINMYKLATYFDGISVTNYPDMGNYTRYVCGAEYALYYLNAKGGWDCLLIEGNGERTDKISRHQYNKSYDNQTIEYEKNTYISEIATSWKLNTGLLDDAQAHKLCWHLLTSNRVYLHDLEADKVIPVVVTNTQNVYKTYKNNNQQPIQYEIDVTESQTKLRQ